MGIRVINAHTFHRSRLQGGITRVMETFIFWNMKIGWLTCKLEDPGSFVLTKLRYVLKCIFSKAQNDNLIYENH